MNPKLPKLRADNARDRAKVEMLLARIEARDKTITEYENTDIIGMVREIGMTPEQLYELLSGFRPKAVEAAEIGASSDIPEKEAKKIEEKIE